MADSIIICKRLLAGTIFLIISFFFQTEPSFAEWKCRPGSPYFYMEFDPASWKVENELNYEEVYKSYEYFEVIFNKGCDEITVKKYINPKTAFKKDAPIEPRPSGHSSIL